MDTQTRLKQLLPAVIALAVVTLAVPVGAWQDIRTVTSLGWDLRYARQARLPDGGRQIVLATDRPIAFAEVWRSPRSMDHPFTIIEMRLDKNDRGEGKILAGTKIYIDKKGNLALEHYGQQPVRFNEIHNAD